MGSKIKSMRGTYHVLMSILIVPLLGAIALALDTFVIMNFNVQQENNAVYAALAAIKEFKETNSTNFTVRANAAVAKAAKVAGINKTLGNNGASQLPYAYFDPRYGEIKFGHIINRQFVQSITVDEYDLRTAQFHPEAVSIVLKAHDNNSIKAVFSKILNYSNFKTSTTAVCFYNPISKVYGVLEYLG